MSKITWDEEGEKLYETGVKNCVLFVYDKSANEGKGGYGKGVAWNGITGISESPSGAESTPLYADDIKYLNLISNEEFSASITAYMYPDEFAECDGSADINSVAGVTAGQQARKRFALCYRTTVGNDTENNAFGYKLHFIYGCLAAPSEKSYSTINDSPEAIEFSWEISTTPVAVTGLKPTATVIVDSTKLDETGKTNLSKLEELIYGTESTESKMLMPDEIATVIKTGSLANTSAVG